MDGYALSYEYLIRRAHQCGCYGRKGADADIFRRLKYDVILFANADKEAIRTGIISNSNQNIKKLLDKHVKNVNEVSSHIRKAIDHVKKKYRTKLTDVQYYELEKIEILLIEPNINKINEAIKRAEKVMLEIDYIQNKNI